jgi:hypothetical protein
VVHVKKVAKIPKPALQKSRRLEVAPTLRNKSVPQLETGILALLSFLGHSYRKGVISGELFETEKAAALQKLEAVKGMETDETADFDEDTPQKGTLLKNKGDITSLLSFLEDSYNEGTISDKSYNELKSENQRKLSRINKLLSKFGGYSGEETQLESPQDIYQNMATPKFEDEGEELDNGEGGLSDLKTDAENIGSDFAESPVPNINLEPKVKPFSFKDRLEEFASGKNRQQYHEAAPQFSETDEILQSLNLNPKKAKREQTISNRQDAIGFSSASPVQAQVNAKAGAMMGKIKGLFGKKAGADAAGSQPIQNAAPQANASATPVQPQSSGGSPSWADKLPEEMTPQELAEYNKAMEDRSKGDEKQEEQSSQLALPQETSGGSGGEGGGASAAEIGKIVLEIEKMKVKIDSFEGTRSATQERVEHIMESIGELRSMIFEKESSSKEQEAKLDKFIEMVSDLEPQKFAKELDKRDRMLSDQSMKVEKLETLVSDVAQNVNKIRSTLEAIGSLKNIATVSKDIADRSTKIENTVSKVERLSDETGRVYVELNRRMNEFTMYRGKQDILAESLKELVNMTESLSGKIDNYSTKEELKEFKKDMEDTKLSINELQTKMVLASEGDELPEHILDLREEKEALEQIFESNEEEFIEGQIKEDEYKKLKDTHIKKLQIVRQKLREELSKIRKEHIKQSVQSQVIKGNVREETQQAEEQELDGSEKENEVEEEISQEEIKPKKQSKQGTSASNPKSPSNLKNPMPQRAASFPKGSAASSIKTASKNMVAPSEIEESSEESSESEIVGDVDDQALENAQETSEMEDASLEAEDDLEEAQANEDVELPEAIDASIPMPPVKTKSIKTKSTPLEKVAPKLQRISPTALVKGRVLTEKIVSSPPSLSLKTEKTLPTRGGMRIFDIIKTASEGKKVFVSAKAATMKNSGTQALIKLEDESGVIYGVFASPLKGQVNVQGNVAKDAQGIKFIKIIKAG